MLSTQWPIIIHFFNPQCNNLIYTASYHDAQYNNLISFPLFRIFRIFAFCLVLHKFSLWVQPISVHESDRASLMRKASVF